MSQPLIKNDTYWSDVWNIMLLRPVYRRPASTPAPSATQASATSASPTPEAAPRPTMEEPQVPEATVSPEEHTPPTHAAGTSPRTEKTPEESEKMRAEFHAAYDFMTNNPDSGYVMVHISKGQVHLGHMDDMSNEQLEQIRDNLNPLLQERFQKRLAAQESLASFPEAAPTPTTEEPQVPKATVSPEEHTAKHVQAEPSTPSSQDDPELLNLQILQVLAAMHQVIDTAPRTLEETVVEDIARKFDETTSALACTRPVTTATREAVRDFQVRVHSLLDSPEHEKQSLYWSGAGVVLPKSSEPAPFAEVRSVRSTIKDSEQGNRSLGQATESVASPFAKPTSQEQSAAAQHIQPKHTVGETQGNEYAAASLTRLQSEIQSALGEGKVVPESGYLLVQVSGGHVSKVQLNDTPAEQVKLIEGWMFGEKRFVHSPPPGLTIADLPPDTAADYAEYAYSQAGRAVAAANAPTQDPSEPSESGVFEMVMLNIRDAYNKTTAGSSEREMLLNSLIQSYVQNYPFGQPNDAGQSDKTTEQTGRVSNGNDRPRFMP